ncbi:putative methanogenesis regulatory protein FilR2 [uncultured archaeon]|nr:putative methanogenesis regulatory protein FilR2 [uncultured archaeon]
MDGAKILVVEDETIIAMDIESRLKSYGYSIFLAHSGEGAVKKAEEAQPDMVLMDIMLGEGMDGIQAAEQIHALFDVPVVYLTAYSDKDTLQRAKITQPFGYLIKPFAERELHVAIEIALYKHKIEKKLKESERLLSATLKSIGDAVIATDEKGIVKLINPFAEALTGWKQEEALEKPLESVFNIINEKARERVEDPIKKVTREGIFFGLADDTVLVSREGTEVPVEIVGTPLIDEKNKVIGAVLIFYDIIERKRLEKQIFNKKAGKPA